MASAPPLAEEGSHFVGGPRKEGLGVRARTATAWPATGAASFLAAVLTWRWQAWRPVHAGLSSWQAGLALAFLHHLQWGPQMVFTFGPYGFLEDVVPFARVTAALGLVYGFGLRWALAGLVVGSLRRTHGFWGAGVLAWLVVGVAANLTEAPELATAVALGLLLTLVAGGGAATSGGPGRRRLLLLGLLGGLAGLQMLVEVNTGLVAMGVAVLGALSVATTVTPGRRASSGLAAVGAVTGPFVALPVVLLAAGGQSLSDLASYLRGSASVALGYTAAMSLSKGRQAEDWLALVDLAALVGLLWLSLRGHAWQQRLAISLAFGGWTWQLAKEGFVRHDLHDLTFFGLAVAAAALVRLPRRFSWHQGSAVVLAAVLAFVANGGVPLSLRSPAESAGALVSEVADLASGPRWAGVTKAAKHEAQRTGDALPGRLLDALARHSFAVEPLEDSMSFAFPALRRWDPEPVLQAYSAYTPYLDHLDSAFLTSRSAPELILYRPVSTSGQDPAWEPPAATEAMYCHYAELLTADYWVLLRKVVGRCGRPQLIGKVVAHFGQPVEVPVVPGEMVLARFSLSLPGVDSLEDALWKAPPVSVTTWSSAGSVVAGGARQRAGGSGRRVGRGAGRGVGGPAPSGLVMSTWRFVTGTARDEHVLSAPALGWTNGYGPASVRRLELSGGGWAAGQGSVQVTFYSVHLGA